jgi:cytochrome c-type biogenesis protein CcmH/NrfF
MIRLAEELRCLVCQNQTIADSQAPLAVDLRQQIREQLAQGRAEEEILGYMTERYGEYVLYRPSFKAATWLLWIGPFALLFCGVWGLFRVLRLRGQHMPCRELSVEDHRRLEALLRPEPRSDKS